MNSASNVVKCGPLYRVRARAGAPRSGCERQRETLVVVYIGAVMRKDGGDRGRPERGGHGSVGPWRLSVRWPGGAGVETGGRCAGRVSGVLNPTPLLPAPDHGETPLQYAQRYLSLMSDCSRPLIRPRS